MYKYVYIYVCVYIYAYTYINLPSFFQRMLPDRTPDVVEVHDLKHLIDRKPSVSGGRAPYIGRDCVKSLLSSHTGLYSRSVGRLDHHIILRCRANRSHTRVTAKFWPGL